MTWRETCFFFHCKLGLYITSCNFHASILPKWSIGWLRCCSKVYDMVLICGETDLYDICKFSEAPCGPFEVKTYWNGWKHDTCPDPYKLGYLEISMCSWAGGHRTVSKHSCLSYTRTITAELSAHQSRAMLSNACQSAPLLEKPLRPPGNAAATPNLFFCPFIASMSNCMKFSSLYSCFWNFWAKIWQGEGQD